MKIIGYCNLNIIHPYTGCLDETQFYVAGNEGSILISCATSLALSWIKPHEMLDHVLPKGNKNNIYSSADKIKKRDESQFKLQQTKLTTSAEKIVITGEQSHNENKRCQAEKNEKKCCYAASDAQNGCVVRETSKTIQFQEETCTFIQG